MFGLELPMDDVQAGLMLREKLSKAICEELKVDQGLENITVLDDLVVFWGNASFVTYEIQTDAEQLFTKNKKMQFTPISTLKIGSN